MITLTPDAAAVLRGHLADDLEHFEREASHPPHPDDRLSMAFYARHLADMVGQLDAEGALDVPRPLHRYMHERLREIIHEGSTHNAALGAVLDSLDPAERQN